jgi:hypothetical protein
MTQFLDFVQSILSQSLHLLVFPRTIAAKTMNLSTVDEPFRGKDLDEFIAHFGLFSMKTTLLKLGITSLDGLVQILTKDTLMTTLEEDSNPADFETLLDAIRKTDIVNHISEKPIPYRLRSGNKKRSGKRKKGRDDDEEDQEVREMRKKKVGIRGMSS